MCKSHRNSRGFCWDVWDVQCLPAFIPKMTPKLQVLTKNRQRAWRERAKSEKKMQLFRRAGALPFKASPNWSMQGAPGMAEIPGIPMKADGGWSFFLPSLNWNDHTAERMRILPAC